MKLLLSLFFFFSLLQAEPISYDEAVSMLSVIKKEDFIEADQVYIKNTLCEMDEHCLGTERDETYKKILTEKAKKENTVSFWYDLDYDTLEVKTIEIIKSDGRRIKFDPEKILKLTKNPYRGFANIYSENEQILTGELPGLDTGDIVHTEEIRIVMKTRMEDNFFTRIYVEGYSPYIKQYCEISIPEDLPLFVHHINKRGNFVMEKQYKKGNKYIYTWTIDVTPQIIYEPYMESRDKFCYYIVLTTVPDWETISRWYYSLVAPHLETDKEMKEKVMELTAGARTKEERIKRIFYWTAQKIRYLGVDKEKERPGFEPHDVTYTFRTRGGVCRDKAALLVAMLRLAGIPADPILISPGSQLDKSAPIIWFGHAIAVSYDERGRPEYFFDPTDENTKDYLPQYEEDCTYIIASEKGDSLCIVPISPPERNNTNIDIKIKVDENKKASCKTTTRYSGLGDTFIRSYLMRLTPEQKKEMIENSLALIHPLSQLKNYTITDPQNKARNIEIQIEFDVPNYLTTQGKYLFFALEATKLSFSNLFDYQMSPFRLSERKYPFKLPGTFSIDISEKVEFGSDVKIISLPKIPDMDYKGFKLNTSFDKKNLEFKSHFSANKLHYAQGDFLPLKSKLGQLEQLEKLYIIGR